VLECFLEGLGYVVVAEASEPERPGDFAVLLGDWLAGCEEGAKGIEADEEVLFGHVVMDWIEREGDVKTGSRGQKNKEKDGSIQHVNSIHCIGSIVCNDKHVTGEMFVLSCTMLGMHDHVSLEEVHFHHSAFLAPTFEEDHSVCLEYSR